MKATIHQFYENYQNEKNKNYSAFFIKKKKLRNGKDS